MSTGISLTLHKRWQWKLLYQLNKQCVFNMRLTKNWPCFSLSHFFLHYLAVGKLILFLFSKAENHASHSNDIWLYSRPLCVPFVIGGVFFLLIHKENLLFTFEQNTELKFCKFKSWGDIRSFSQLQHKCNAGILPKGKEKHFRPQGDFIWLHMNEKCTSF